MGARSGNSSVTAQPADPAGVASDATVVLVAERDPFNLRLLQEVCEGAGYRVITAATGSEVLDVVARQRPDLILLDAHVDDPASFEVLRILKADAALGPIPVLLVTPREALESRSRGLELGAEDYVTKPYVVFEARQRIHNALRLARASEPPAQSGVRSASTDDALDRGVGTSRQLAISLEYEHTRAVRYEHPLTCLVLRPAGPDSANETASEDTARRLAVGLRQSLRAVDQVFRSTETELVVLLPETDEHGAGVVMKRLRARLQDGSLSGGDPAVLPPMEMGTATWPAQCTENGETLLDRAREASRSF